MISPYDWISIKKVIVPFPLLAGCNWGHGTSEEISGKNLEHNFKRLLWRIGERMELYFFKGGNRRMLRGRKMHKIGFPHLTFLSYLAFRYGRAIHQKNTKNI